MAERGPEDCLVEAQEEFAAAGEERWRSSEALRGLSVMLTLSEGVETEIEVCPICLRSGLGSGLLGT